ncbi:MAG: amidase [Hahellaceae bacterium]|nr:amidase [Hahellaceae bacterium]MCP5169923.1 amidase [Hahellaceae bacterium]
MSYDLKSLRVPRLAGMTLRSMVSLLENNYARRFLQHPLNKEAGLPLLQQAVLTTAPTPFPKFGTECIADADWSVPDLSLFQPSPSARSPFTSVSDLARAYREGTATPNAIAEKLIFAIQRANEGQKPLRAIINFNEQDIRQQASRATERLWEGKSLSWLDGIPVAIKDELDCVPYATSVGTQVYGQNQSAEEDATVVARLKEAGAIIIGKANMHEIGMGVSGANPHFGVCRNPYHIDHHSGGSSSGSAAAVAAGLCPVAIGADGGGSIRIPAALCGLVGLKPTWSRVSEFGAAPLCWSVAHVGPIGSCVDDVAMVYQLTAGPDPRDPNSLIQPPVHLNNYQKSDLKGLTIGIYTPWFEHADAEVVARCYEAIAHLEAAGATRKEIVIEHLNLQRIAHAVTIASEMLTAVDAEYEADKSRFGNDVRLTLALAGTFSARDYVKAQQVRTLAIESFIQAFEEVDVIVTPTTAVTAPKINQAAQPQGESNLTILSELMRFVTSGNLTGLPALSVPAGYDAAGLPIGVQLIGRPWDESLLLRMGKVIENSTERQAPTHYTALL